ncbi:TPA: hypothetical protein QEM55_002637, partial [Pseudomonas putida]|nr:hypothetical protein [Pseudomonas putida]
ELSFDVPNTPVPESPSDLVVAPNGASISGTAPIGSEVEVRDADGNVIGSVVVGADGTFVVALTPPQANGEQLDVVAIDADGNSSLPTLITAPDFTAPEVPTDLVVSADGSTLSGRAEPGSTVRVIGVGGTELGSVLVGPTGAFSVAFAPPLVNGEALQVSATDVQGNISGFGTVNAPDIDSPIDTTAPLAPSNLLISSDGRTLSGRGEAGTTVKVLNADGTVLVSATVLADGSFSLQLPTAITDGSARQVTLTDAAGNVSPSASVTSPDLQAPEQPSDLTLTDGNSLTGSAEVGARVEVRDAAGELIGSGTVGEDGTFTLILDPPQANGEALAVSVIDATGNASAPLAFDAPDITPPGIISNVTVGTGGLAIAGRGEAGAQVQIRDADGNLIGEGTVGANGSFLINLDAAVAPGEPIVLVQTDAAGNASPELSYNVPNTPVPASPSDLSVAPDGSSISGTAPAGSEVQVRDADGNVIGSVAVGDDGTFVLPLSPAQANGELLDVVTVDADGNSSLPTAITAPDITAPDIPTALAVSADGTQVTGRAEPGSTVRVVGANGSELGSAQAGANGVFTITLDPAQVGGEALQVSASDAKGNTSGFASVNAPDIDNPIDTTAPQPASNLLFSGDGRTITGRGEAGATVKVLNADGTVLASSVVLADGSFSVQLPASVTDGSTRQVTLTDAAGNVSQPATATSPDLEAPAQPTGLSLTDGDSLSGSAEANAQVEVRDAAGTVIGSGTVGPDGTFTLTLDPPQANGEVLDIRVIDAKGNTSVPLAFDAPDITPPTVISDVTVGAGGLTLAGRGEAGAQVQVRDADGNLIGEGTVADNGTFLIDLEAAVAPGDAIVLVQTDAAGNISPELSFDVPNTPVPATPSELVPAADGTSISGTAPAGTRVEVRDVDDNVVGTVVVGAEGTFVVVLTPPQANGEQLDVVAIDGDGNSSLPAQVTAPDITAPAIPTELAVSADGTQLTGRAEPGSTVRVVDADGTDLGSAEAGTNGVFTLTLDPPQVDGETLLVTASDAQGNESDTATVTAPFIDTPIDNTPPEQASNVLISPDGRTISGRGEVGAIVKVVDDQGQELVSGTVQPDGSFSVQLPTAVTDGSDLQITLTDAAGNVSPPATVTSPDLTAPEQPTGLTLIDGNSLSGSAEPAARVEVRDASGDLIGSAEVAPDGTFSLILEPAQANGEVLDIRVIDADGNTSIPLAYDAPDITPPAPATDITVGSGGLAVSGRGEAGASVQVRNVDGDVIGNGVVGPNGTFLVDLDPAVAPGDTIVVFQSDAAGNLSVGQSFNVPNTPVPDSPSELVPAADGSSIGGTAPAGTEVQVRDADGNVIGSVVVGDDGTFVVPLTPAQANGEVLDVVAIDPDGNSSLPTQVTAPDITAPDPATNLQLSADGVTLVGNGEPGANVEVTDADGTVIASGVVGPNGVFTLTLSPAQDDGQALEVRLSDAEGNTSAATAITAPDLDGPLLPSGFAIDASGTLLTGVGQAGSTVTVRSAAGDLLGTAIVAADGRFSVTLGQPQRDGESLAISADDPRGNTAGPVNFNVPDTLALPVTDEAISPDGSLVSGQGEPGATITVRGPAGEFLGSGVVGPLGDFEVTLIPAQTNGQALTIDQRDLAGNLSTAVAVTAPDTETPDAPTGLGLSADGSVLSGSGEPGATVTVTGTNGVELGSAVVQSDGSFQVTLDPPQLNGQTLSATQADAAGNVSEASDPLNAPDLQAPAPAQGVVRDDSGSVISGQGEPGTTVEVRDPNGGLIGSDVVGPDGTFSVTLNPVPNNGETLSVVLVDDAGLISGSVPVTAIDTTPPALPTGLQVNNDGTLVWGTGEVGTTVEVRNADGDVLGTVTVPAGGTFAVPLDPAQRDGETLDVVLIDASGNETVPVATTAPDLTAPAQPTDVTVRVDGTVTGNAPGATEVIIRDGNGDVLVSAPVSPDGSFTVTLPTDQDNGQSLTLEAIDAATNSSPLVPITAPDTTPPAAATDITVSPGGDTVGGTAEPGSTVIVRDGNDELGSVVAGPDGTFVIPLDPPLSNGDTVQVVVRDPAGNETSVDISGPDGTEVAAPSDLAISADGFLLTGQGTVGALITVTSGGTTLGTAIVGTDGVFRVFFTNAQLDAQTLQVNARLGAGGKPSIPVTIVADDSTAPDAPTQLQVDRSGSTLTGRGEVGATVTVVNAAGTQVGTGTVGSNGLFSITFDTPQANGQTLTVTQADAAGNVSLANTVPTVDLQAPIAATEVTLNTAATVVSGSGEAGAQVTVRDANGNVLATGNVNASGQFQITLPSAQTTGAPLQVTLSDSAGNSSPPTSVATPDRTPPAAVSDTLLSADGRQLAGSGEVGATVQVRNAAGTLLGSATVGADGRFTVVFDTPQASGQPIGVTQVDAAGNTSPAISVTTSDLTPPAPLTNLVLNNNGLTLTGLGEAGASVTVRGPDGTIIGTGQVAANGSFSLTLDTAQLNAQRLSVTQADAGNNTSTAVNVTAPDLTPPAAPSNLALAPSGVQLTGSAEAGSTVLVRDSLGNVIGTTVAASNGTFQVDLSSVQANGETLRVTATDAAGNVSPAGSFTAPDTTPPAAVGNLAVSADGNSLAGVGEAGATVTVSAADGTPLGTTTVAADGSFTVPLNPAATPGESLSVVQTDTSDNPSPAQTITAPGNLAPDVPSNLELADDGLSVTGSGTIGSTVSVYGPGGVLLGSGVVGNDGTFNIALGSVQANGEVLQVSAVGTDNSASLPATLQAPDTTAPQPLSDLQLSTDGLTLTGRGEVGARVTIIGQGGVDLGEGIVAADGTFSIDLAVAQINGETITGSQFDAAGNESNSINLTAPDRVAPDAPENLAFAGSGTLLNGTGEAGAKVNVLAADGTSLGNGTVRADGSFQVTLTPPQTNGQTVNVVLTDAAGNQSAASSLGAADTTAPDPVTTLAVSSDGALLTGRGEAGATVTVTGPNGLSESIQVDPNGYFAITLDPPLGNAQLLSLTQADAAGNVSAPATVLSPDFTPPALLTEVARNDDGSVVTGRGEVGATVTVTNAAGTELGKTTVLADGSFRVELTPAQINGEALSVQQADPPGNISLPVVINAPDLTPPEAPTELRLNAAGDQLSGVGEPGTTVTVYLGLGQTKTTVVGDDGTFQVALDAPQLNGQQLLVTLTDIAGNVSPFGTYTAPDITPPQAVVAAINDSGTQLRGTGEAGAKLTVINDKGEQVGTGSIDADGTFVVNLSPSQVNGEVLSIIAQDATGNPSAPTFVDASDLTPPEQPIDLILSNAGATLSGTAEAGSTITVLSPDNTQIGVILVPDNGSFSVTLNPAQSNGQTLTVIATDEAGNASVPGSVTALDTTAPDQATNITINTDRSVLSGRGEPGAEVSVSRGGNVLGTGRVAANGTFEITLDPPATGLLPVLTIKQTDEAGNSSDTGYTVPLIAAPAAPTNVELAGDGLTVTGSAAAGSQIRVYDSANQLIGSGVTSINGGFNFQLDTPQLNGETISVVVFIALGNESPPVIIDAADITPPAAPLVANLSTNGLVLTGTGEPGASVTVRDANGDVLGTGTVNAGGAFSVNLNTPQLNGQVLAVTQADAAGNVSDDTSYTARDVQAPGAPTELAVDGTGTVLTGKGEPGATISIVGQAGTAIVGSDGNFTFTLSPAQLDGQSLTVRQADAAGNLSGAGSVTAPDSTAPAAPIATINTTGAVVSGSGVAGNTITVRNSSGTVLGSAVVAATGAYAITLNPPQTDFQALSVTQSDPTGNTSAGTALTAPDFTPPAAATALVINADGSVLTGRGEPGATVTVRGPTGTVLTTAPVEADGTFRVVLNPAQDNGQSLSVTVTDPRNNTSASASITAPDVDANTPVVASDNLATATVELAAVSSSKTYADSFTTVLAGFQKTYTWTVAAGTTADPTLTLNTDSVVALLDNTTFTLQVKDASGAWVTLASGTSQGLLDLILLPLGQGLQVDIGTLQAGDYRLTVGSGGIGVLTTVTTTLDITSTSLTEFTGTGTAATGNVITDPGIDGTTDVRGPDSAAVLQVLKNGVYVDAGAGTTVQGLYGTLVIRADGSYTYTPSGSPSSVGKVDVFSYQLATDGGLKDTANLYVRIDSPQATEIWSDTNYSAPATVVDAVNDVDNTGISLINRETTSTANLATLNLPVLGSRSITSAANMVALDTTADLQVVLNSNNLLGLLNGTKIELLKANASGTFVVVDTVNGGSLISLLGGGAAHTFQDQGPGSYQIKVTAGGIGLLSSINTTINTTTTYNKEFMVSGYTPVSGNLINDTSGTGSDTLGSTLTVLSVLVAANTYSIPGYNGVSVTGTYGTLLVHEDGSYTYTLKSGLTSAVIGQHDTFTYQLTHPNGTSDTAQLTVNLTEAGTVTAFSSLLADTSGDDGAAQMASLAAVSSSDLIQGSEGNDHLDGSQGGAISLQGGAGDDTLVIVDQQFTNVDGGSGTDTLLWAGGDASIDLGNLVGRVHDIEIIDLNDTSAVTLSLNLADVIAVTETGNDTLLIKGGSEDSVQLTDNWTVNGNQTADGIDYTQYTAQEDPSHHLWVQNGIHVV